MQPRPRTIHVCVTFVSLRLDGDKLSMHDTASASTFNFTRCAP
jgi:hypothetical protein